MTGDELAAVRAALARDDVEAAAAAIAAAERDAFVHGDDQLAGQLSELRVLACSDVELALGFLDRLFGPAPVDEPPAESSRGVGRGRSQATLIVGLVLDVEGTELFHSPAGEAFVMIAGGDHRECWPVRSTVFRRWLARLFYDEAGSAPGSQALQDALGVLEGRALFAGFEHNVALRVAEHEGAIWIDLADERWQAVRVDRDGWAVVHDPPVRFRRPRGMLALPTPVKGGSVDDLHPFVNVSETDWPLFLGWLIGLFRPRGPYVVLVVNGEQGAAKSTLVRVGRALSDPNEAPVRREPKDGQDLIVVARNGLLVAFDNVSRLSPELSDDLARLATGSGFGARQLYTDLEEIVVQVARPIAINGIEEIATRGDLLDRSLVLTLPRIDRFRDEDEFWRAFTAASPMILGALMTALSSALRRYEQTATPNVRMADFARWVIAAEPALGLEPGTFMAAYRDNRAAAVQVILEASPIAVHVQTVAATGGFDGTASQLLDRLAALTGESEVKKRGWPSRANVLSGMLRRLAPTLRRLGVEVEFVRATDRTRARHITIRTIPESSSGIVRDRPTADAADDADDADDDSPHVSSVDLDEIDRLETIYNEAER